MLGQRVGHCAYGFVLIQTYRLAITAVRSPIVPCAHERVLKNRKLIGIVADIVHETVDKRFGDLAALHADRAGDRKASLVTRHTRDQILPIVNRFRQSLELGAVAKKVGAHCGHYID